MITLDYQEFNVVVNRMRRITRAGPLPRLARFSKITRTPNQSHLFCHYERYDYTTAREAGVRRPNRFRSLPAFYKLAERSAGQPPQLSITKRNKIALFFPRET